MTLTKDELDEAIADLDEGDQNELYAEAVWYCMDHSGYFKANYRQKHKMVEDTMRMMMRQALNQAGKVVEMERKERGNDKKRSD